MLYYISGSSWVPVTDQVYQNDLSLDRLLANNASLSASGKAILSFALLRDNIRPSASEEFITSLFNSIRVQGRTAYLTEPHSNQPNFLASAVMINVFVQTQNTNPLVEKVVNFASMSKTPDFPHFFYLSSYQLTFILSGISNYDQWRGNAEPDLNLSVAASGVEILNGSFRSPSDRPVHVAMFFEDIPTQDMVKFLVTGKGEASVVFGATFVPAQINNESIYRGIQVEKVIQLLDPATNKPIGGPITSAVVGQRVIVTIQITIPDYSSSVKISDSFPAAIEPFDENIYDTSSSPPLATGFWNYWWWYFYRAFSTKEFKRDRVVFHGQQLFAGTHSVTYTALVNNEGEFVVPPAYAWDGIQPELMGLSAGGVFTTKAMSMGTPTVDPALSACLSWEARVERRKNLNLITPEYQFIDLSPTPPLPVDPISWWIPVVIALSVLAVGTVVAISVMHLRGFFKPATPFQQLK